MDLSNGTPTLAPSSVTGPGAALVEMLGVSKSYGEKTVLRQVSLRIEAGDCVAVVGPNGAGKTSLLRLITGLAMPSNGDAVVRRQRGSRLGVLVDQPAIFPAKSVLQQLRMADRLGGASRLEEIEHRLSLTPYRKTIGRDLSQGTRKRLAIAIAILMRPDVMVMDEPLSGVDKILQPAVSRCLLDEVKAGVALVFTDHEFSELVDRSAACLIVRGGAVVRIENDSLNERTSGPQTEMAFADGPSALALASILEAHGEIVERVDEVTLRVSASPQLANEHAVRSGLVAVSLTSVSEPFSLRILNELAGDHR